MVGPTLCIHRRQRVVPQRSPSSQIVWAPWGHYLPNSKAMPFPWGSTGSTLLQPMGLKK